MTSAAVAAPPAAEFLKNIATSIGEIAAIDAEIARL
jgi:hypothetical protein